MSPINEDIDCSFYLNALMIPHGWAFAWSIVNELLPVGFEATERSSTDVLLNHHTNCRCIVESRKLILFHLLAAYKQFTTADLWSLDWRRVPVSLPVSCQPSFQQHPFKFQKQHRRESRWWLFGWSVSKRKYHNSSPPTSRTLQGMRYRISLGLY